ncbi:GNAT family N-acetyltransferase [uncultured Arthrobacter sp.]|uniref:GNAT family N-acetyltransferase n=1 Tax=uncultured Arthrobacter sp. TaxID=114050 RepID=UPI0025DE4B2D|nr:GNAT family N-acetyltransferase [uncultured Arthrobacter sp.]
MQITLSLMPAERLGRWLAGSMNTYIGERMRSGETPGQARANAERSLQAFFPAGRPAPGHRVYHLMADGSPVGYLWIGPTESEEAAWWVYDIEVDEPFRHRGVGRQAMLLAEEDARRGGATSLGLNVFGHNQPAQRLYEQLGYTATAIQMKKQLSGQDAPAGGEPFVKTEGTHR